MNFVEEMKNKAKSLQNSLVLPEGTEERTVIAAGKIIAEKVAKKVILIGNVDEVKKVAAANKVSLDGVDIIDSTSSEWNEEFANEYYELRKKKGMTPEQAKEDIKNPLRFGAMMVRKDKVFCRKAGYSVQSQRKRGRGQRFSCTRTCADCARKQAHAFKAQRL